jgi:hypothetical protein
MQYRASTPPPDRSIQPFATIPAMVFFPTGCMFPTVSPSVALIICSALRSPLCGMWPGLGGIHFPFAFSPLNLDFRAIIAPAQFCYTGRSDIE